MKKVRKVFVKTNKFDPLENAISYLNHTVSTINLIDQINDGIYIDDNGETVYDYKMTDREKLDEIIGQLNILRKEIQNTLFYISVIRYYQTQEGDNHE